MITLELNHYGAWYKLYPPNDVLEEVEDIEKPNPLVKYTTTFEVADSLSLAQWMRRNSYRQAYVFLTYIPEIKVINTKQKWTPEEEAQAKVLYESMQTPKPDWDQLEDTPDGVKSYWIDKVKVAAKACNTSN